jgi:hypothetical protein
MVRKNPHFGHAIPCNNFFSLSWLSYFASFNSISCSWRASNSAALIDIFFTPWQQHAWQRNQCAVYTFHSQPASGRCASFSCCLRPVLCVSTCCARQRVVRVMCVSTVVLCVAGFFATLRCVDINTRAANSLQLPFSRVCSRDVAAPHCLFTLFL